MYIRAPQRTTALKLYLFMHMVPIVLKHANKCYVKFCCSISGFCSETHFETTDKTVFKRDVNLLPLISQKKLRRIYYNKILLEELPEGSLKRTYAYKVGKHTLIRVSFSCLLHKKIHRNVSTSFMTSKFRQALKPIAPEMSNQHQN